jgi:hypothetical protein
MQPRNYKNEELALSQQILHDGARVGNPVADSRQVGGKVAGIGWKLLAS